MNEKENKTLGEKIKSFDYNLKKQRFKYGTVATLFTVVVIAAVILLNVVVGILTDYYGINFDMTSEKRMTISEETVDILKDLDREISVNVLMTEEEFRLSTYGNEMTEILKKYEVNSSGNVKVNFVDPLRNPTFAQTYQADIVLSKGDIIVQDETDADNYTYIANEDIYYWYDETHQEVSGVYIERRVTNALVTLTTDKDSMPAAAILYGHGEYNTDHYAEMLEDANYRVYAINLLLSDIPDDVSLVVLSAPSTDYTEEEIEKLEAYLNRWNNFVFLHSSAITKLTNLELLFREYGVAFEEAVALDAYYHVNSSRYNLVASVPSNVESKLVANLDSTQLVVMPYSRVMRQLWTEKSNMTSTSILNSSSYSYGKKVEPGVPLASYEAEAGDLAGGFASAIHVTQTGTEGKKSVEKNLLFLSSAFVFDESFVNTESYGNMQLFTNVFSQFNKASTTVSVTAKKYTDPALTVAGASRTVVLVLLCLIPVAVLAMGIVVWQRRKNR
ncbi:MAG: GldG family protein [Clostridia bacterium]|nr:GldG family protein [Clostridia bacterium]